MARPRSLHVAEVKRRLEQRLAEGLHRPGDKFPPAREIADRFGISYQTAHRVLAELESEGKLERRASAGTFIPGGKVFWDGAQLIFSERARRADSFGSRLLDKLTRRLERDGVSFKISWDDDGKLRRNFIPVIWEAPVALETCARTKRPALLLNDRPRPGLSSAFIDAVSIDDFSGGAGAAELLIQAAGFTDGLAIITGPEHDSRSRQRTDGFLSVAANVPVVCAGSWFFEDGYRVAPLAYAAGPNGVFCCNDRLADGFASWCADRNLKPPPLVGFDDAPVAEKLNLTTMAIPWEEFVNGAADLIKRRLNGDSGAAHQLILTPRPVVRRARSNSPA